MSLHCLYNWIFPWLFVPVIWFFPIMDLLEQHSRGCWMCENIESYDFVTNRFDCNLFRTLQVSLMPVSCGLICPVEIGGRGIQLQTALGLKVNSKNHSTFTLCSNFLPSMVKGIWYILSQTSLVPDAALTSDLHCSFLGLCVTGKYLEISCLTYSKYQPRCYWE